METDWCWDHALGDPDDLGPQACHECGHGCPAAADEDALDWELFLVDWGYNTADERERHQGRHLHEVACRGVGQVAREHRRRGPTERDREPDAGDRADEHHDEVLDERGAVDEAAPEAHRVQHEQALVLSERAQERRIQQHRGGHQRQNPREHDDHIAQRARRLAQGFFYLAEAHDLELGLGVVALADAVDELRVRGVDTHAHARELGGEVERSLRGSEREQHRAVDLRPGAGEHAEDARLDRADQISVAWVALLELGGLEAQDDAAQWGRGVRERGPTAIVRKPRPLRELQPHRREVARADAMEDDHALGVGGVAQRVEQRREGGDHPGIGLQSCDHAVGHIAQADAAAQHQGRGLVGAAFGRDQEIVAEPVDVSAGGLLVALEEAEKGRDHKGTHQHREHAHEGDPRAVPEVL